jgi:hypothetical protein
MHKVLQGREFSLKAQALRVYEYENADAWGSIG